MKFADGAMGFWDGFAGGEIAIGGESGGGTIMAFCVGRGGGGPIAFCDGSVDAKTGGATGKTFCRPDCAGICNTLDLTRAKVFLLDSSWETFKSFS